MKTLAIALGTLTLAACAASTQPAPRDPATATIAFPARTSGGDELPTVRRFNRAIALEHQGQVEAGIRVCVTPAGQVASASVVESSGMSAYDQAVVDDARTWTFEPFAAPEQTRVCETVKVGYQAG